MSAETTATTLTMRTRIEVRWSTMLSLVGYADSPEQRESAIAEFRARTPDFVGTVRQALEYARSHYIAGGTYQRWEFARRSSGELVERWELERLEFDADRAEDKRRGR